MTQSTKGSSEERDFIHIFVTINSITPVGYRVFSESVSPKVLDLGVSMTTSVSDYKGVRTFRTVLVWTRVSSSVNKSSHGDREFGTAFTFRHYPSLCLTILGLSASHPSILLQ